MAYSISGPVGDKKRITKPDPKKKNEKFANVGNKPADVELVQLMLTANGYPHEPTGKMNGGIIKSIRAFQKSKLGFKKPDGIVDPGGKTWKAGQAALNAHMKTITSIQVYEVRENGKVKYVEKAEFEAKQAKLLRIVRVKAEGWYSMCEFYYGELRDADAMLQSADGFMMAMVEFSVRSVNSKAKPPYNPILTARSEAGMLVALAKSSKPDWRKIEAQETKAVKAYNKAVKAFNTFLDARIGTAGKMAKGAEITSEVSFGIVEAYATGYLVVTRGMPPAKAHAIAAAGTQALKSSSLQLGNHLAGNKVDMGSIVTDSLFAGAAGFVGGKVGAAFLNGAASKLGAKAAGKFSSRIGKKASELFFQKFLATGYGQGLIENAAKETVGYFKTAVTKGRPPSKKEFEDSVMKILMGSAFSSPASKSLTAWDIKVVPKSRAFLEGTLTPKTLDGVKKSLAKEFGKDLVHDVTGKIYKGLQEDVWRAFGNKVVEQGALYATDRLTGAQSESQLQKLTEEGIKRDAKLRLQIHYMMEARLRTELEKQKAIAK